ncbi:MAG TPA: hypothetical protein VFG81_19150 [Anaerolineales bacterium]|nr:hypothetical protein [Anaerolineales bacterium]
MKQSLFLSLCMVLLAACASPSTATNLPAVATEPPTLAAPTDDSAVQPATSQEATPLPIATSRGPELHATDPTTVSLASGGLQFVEFFRFT